MSMSMSISHLYRHKSIESVREPVKDIRDSE